MDTTLPTPPRHPRQMILLLPLFSTGDNASNHVIFRFFVFFFKFFNLTSLNGVTFLFVTHATARTHVRQNSPPWMCTSCEPSFACVERSTERSGTAAVGEAATEMAEFFSFFFSFLSLCKKSTKSTKSNHQITHTHLLSHSSSSSVHWN